MGRWETELVPKQCFQQLQNYQFRSRSAVQVLFRTLLCPTFYEKGSGVPGEEAEQADAKKGGPKKKSKAKGTTIRLFG